MCIRDREKTAEEIEDEPAIAGLTQQGVKFPEESSGATVEDTAGFYYA